MRTVGPVTVDLAVRVRGERRRRLRSWAAIRVFRLGAALWPGTVELEIQ